MTSLRSFLPQEFFIEFMDTPAARYLDVEISKEYGHSSQNFAKWPGSQKHVYNWVELTNGYAVGWNENPSRGWSFPVVKLN